MRYSQPLFSSFFIAHETVLRGRGGRSNRKLKIHSDPKHTPKKRKKKRSPEKKEKRKRKEKKKSSFREKKMREHSSLQQPPQTLTKKSQAGGKNNKPQMSSSPNPEQTVRGNPHPHLWGKIYARQNQPIIAARMGQQFPTQS